MKKLDWYILKKFLVTFAFTILIITLIAVVIDSSEKAENFVQSGLTTWQLITKYFIGFIPFIMYLIFPLMVFIAVIYFSSKMAGHSEFIAILAGGVKYHRMLRPYLIGSVLLSIIFWLASQYWVPRANELMTNFQATYVDKFSSYNSNPFRNNNYYLRVDSVTYVGMRYYDTTTKSANNFFLSKVKDNKIFYNLRAESIRWDTAKKNWKLDNIIERKFDGLKESTKKIPTMNLNLNVKPQEMRRDDYLKGKLTTPELKEFIRMEEIRGSEGLNTFKEELYHRDAAPFTIIIMTMIGAIISTRKVRGGSGVQLAIGLVAASIFVVMDKFSVTFAIKGNFSPALAAWVPNIVFGGLAWLLYWKTPK